MIEIFRKGGWELNPNDRVINNIIKMIEKNNGECPCANESVDKHCPCTDYRDKGICHCGLYVKKVNKEFRTPVPSGEEADS